jgi:hypothetical protein
MDELDKGDEMPAVGGPKCSKEKNRQVGCPFGECYLRPPAALVLGKPCCFASIEILLPSCSPTGHTFLRLNAGAAALPRAPEDTDW